MAIGKTAYIREFTEKEIEILNGIAQQYDLKNATDVLKLCLSRFPELIGEVKQIRKENSKLEEALRQEQRTVKELKRQVMDFFNIERDLERKRKALINIFE